MAIFRSTPPPPRKTEGISLNKVATAQNIKVIGGGSGPKNFLKSSRVYMIENLFTNPKLFTEYKNNRVSRFCGRSRADRYAPKTGFSLYKIGGENATFWPKMCSKSAKNGPKHLKFTPKQHFCEYFQEIWAKIYTSQKFGRCHSFSPQNPSKFPFLRENPFLSIITEKFSALRKIVIEV